MYLKPQYLWRGYLIMWSSRQVSITSYEEELKWGVLIEDFENVDNRQISDALHTFGVDRIFIYSDQISFSLVHNVIKIMYLKSLGNTFFYRSKIIQLNSFNL